MIANQAVQAGCHELEAVNELQVPYTEGHELLIRVGFPSILRLPIWLLISTGFLTDQMSVVAPDIMHDNG